MKTKFDSYSLNGIPEGCKRCVAGQKMVLFISGKCARNCVYCPLSKLRKNSEKTWANERECRSVKDAIQEVKGSNSNSCSITGGDPLLNLKKTLLYARALKNNFKDFHIHIYLSTKLVDEKNLKKLAEFVDEVRFHPEFLSSKEKFDEDVLKVKMAKKFWKRGNIGLEMPMIPGREVEMLEFILKVRESIDFVNLNELEIGDTNFDYIVNEFSLDKEGYTVRWSIKKGLWLMKEIEKANGKLKVHLCTAKTKNWHQYKNRLKNHTIMEFGKRTSDGTVIYFYTKSDVSDKIKKEDYFHDLQKKRYILNPKIVNQINCEVFRSEEYPTLDGDEVELEKIK